MNEKRILVIYTGGTIGMKRTERGYTPAPGFFSEAIESISDLWREDFPRFDLYEMSPLLDSSNMTVKEWNSIAKIIYESYAEYDGFVILHGTDTMAYTASALSFILEGLDKAVVLTGSQIPLCRMRSDGTDNLVSSILVAASGEVREVCIYFGGELMRGNRATKVSADDLKAFASPNYPRLADVGTSIVYRKKFLYQPKGEGLTLVELSPIPIAVIKMFPGFSAELVRSLVASGVRAIVLEAFGAGNIPSSAELSLALSEAVLRGAVIVVTSQCGRGNVAIGTYATSQMLKKIGAVSGFDMTTEAAVAKLYYLFSKYENDTDKIKALMECDLRGEVSFDER